MKKAMQAFLCSGLVLLVALFAVGCQSSGNGGSLKAEQIVFDMECQISVSASEKEVACGTLKNSGTETVFILTSPETAKGLCYQDTNGTVQISRLTELKLYCRNTVGFHSWCRYCVMQRNNPSYWKTKETVSFQAVRNKVCPL